MLTSVAKIWKSLLLHLTFESYKATVSIKRITVKDPAEMSKKLPPLCIKHIGQ
jgi:hypothetical protein